MAINTKTYFLQAHTHTMSTKDASLYILLKTLMVFFYLVLPENVPKCVFTVRLTAAHRIVSRVFPEYP